MNHTRVLKKIGLIVPITLFFLISCDVTKRNVTPPPPASSCTATTNLSYGSACTTNAGCTLTFSCPLQSSSSMTKLFDVLTTKVLSFQALQTSVEQLTITSITTVGAPALLQTTPGLVSKSWYSNSTGDVTIPCTNDNGQISCSQFGPVGSKFDIVGTLGTQDVTVHVTVIDDVSPIVNTAADLTAGCGQFGTTYQRIFDCSERVTNFAGVGSYGSPSTFQTNPNANWFLVGCPVFTGTTVGIDTTVQQCAWLSPVIETGNPVIGINFNSSATPTTDPTSPNFVSGVTRILWSGSLKNSATTGIYANFGSIVGTDGNGYANCYNPSGTGECAKYYTGTGASAPYTYTQMLPVSDGMTASNVQNICATQLMANDNSFSGMSTTPYSWIVPSYPMLMTLTGGSSGFGSCTAGAGTNGSCNAAGFSAISTPVPSFDNTTNNSTSLWSSSLFNGSSAWQFAGFAGKGLVFNANGLHSHPTAVRCASLAW